MISDNLPCVSWDVISFVYSVIEYVWHLVLVLVYGSRRNQIPPIRDQILLESATGLAKKIRNRQVTSLEVVTAYIDRIETINPILNSVTEERYKEAIAEAKAVDEYIAKSGKTPEQLAQEKPLLGVPFTSKNAVGIKGMIMDAGVQVKKDFRPTEDAASVAALRNAGGIPLGITNVPEALMCLDASNTLYGRTNNPYDLTRTPGGSTGGESSLIAAAGSILGIGTDIAGSIRIPCYNSGIFGHKPTIRIVSNKGHYPQTYETGLDNYNTTGPMCRYAEDLIPAFKIMAGANVSKLKLDEKVNVKTLKVFYTDDNASGPFTSPPEKDMRDAVVRVVTYLEKNLGVQVQKVKLPVKVKDWTPIWITKICTAEAPSLMEVVTGSKDVISIPMELVKWVFRVSKHTLNMIVMLTLMTHSSNLEPEVVKTHDDMTKEMDKFFKEHLGNDGVFIFPPQAGKPFYHQELAFKINSWGYTGMFNILGYPATQCPIGLSAEGLPLGVQVIGLPHNDHLTLAVAQEIEKGFGGWKSPSLIKIRS